MNITAEIIKDSLSPYGERITTFKLKAPSSLARMLADYKMLSVHHRHGSIVVTGTEFETFFQETSADTTEKSVRDVAVELQASYDRSMPDLVGFGGWHIPYGDNLIDSIVVSTATWAVINGALLPETLEYNLALLEFKIKVALAHCWMADATPPANANDYDNAVVLCDTILGINGSDMKASEHIAYAVRDNALHDNIRGWLSYRRKLADKTALTVAETPQRIHEVGGLIPTGGG